MESSQVFGLALVLGPSHATGPAKTEELGLSYRPARPNRARSTPSRSHEPYLPARRPLCAALLQPRRLAATPPPLEPRVETGSPPVPRCPARPLQPRLGASPVAATPPVSPSPVAEAARPHWPLPRSRLGASPLRRLPAPRLGLAVGPSLVPTRPAPSGPAAVPSRPAPHPHSQAHSATGLGGWAPPSSPALAVSRAGVGVWDQRPPAAARRPAWAWRGDALALAVRLSRSGS